MPRLNFFSASLTCFAVLTLAEPAPARAVAVLSLASTFVSQRGAAAPSPGSSSDFQPAPGNTSNLGAFDIVFNADSTVSAAALAAMNRAAAQWKTRISDPIQVNINANFTGLGPNILGSTNSVVLAGGYDVVRNAVVADAGNEPSNTVATQIPAAANATFRLPASFSTDGNLDLTKANAKALGFTGLDTAFGASDAQMTFSTNFPFDFDRSNGITLGQYDFESVVAHEIGHALGFISNVDYVDFVLSLDPASRGTMPLKVEPTTLDLFRFDDGGPEDPATLADFATFPRSMIPGNAENTDQITGVIGAAEVPMSTGLTQGDGRQASHWKDGLSLGLMDPTLASGVISQLLDNDFRAIDLIGYEVAAVPEAGAFLLLAVVTLFSGSAGIAARSCIRKRPASRY
jgi:hypothetical protein